MMAEECAGTMVNPESVSRVPDKVDCQAKRYCTQMKTCAEARAYLTSATFRAWTGTRIKCRVRRCVIEQGRDSHHGTIAHGDATILKKRTGYLENIFFNSSISYWFA